MPFSLPNAVHGKVVTRFPPEPSWMLDLGHCKASLMNEHIAAHFQGQWILRFDDTNPKTCSRANVEAYLQDMPLLGLKPDRVTYASDYFAAMIATTTELVRSGFMYADDTPTEEMRAQRLAKLASPQRNRSPQDSLAAWAEMQAGSEAGQRFCLRFKLNPESENGALRDPVAWRGISEPHYKTGTRFRVYPTYDFAAPWLDLCEGVTHALRTLEFRDRDELYNAVQQAILQHHPEWAASNIWEFPRIHMAYTPQAKVHQKALLAAGLVEGPTDPRLPTLRGLMRAGCHPDALRAFLLEQVTPARKETYHAWDKLWTLNRRLLDPSAARHMAVADEGRVPVTVLDGPVEPQEAEVVWKQGHVVRVVRYRQIWIDQEDAQALTKGDEITLLAWGNAIIQSVQYAASDSVPSPPPPPQQPPQHQPQHQLQQQQLTPQDAAAHAVPDQQQQQQHLVLPMHSNHGAAAKPPLSPYTSPMKPQQTIRATAAAAAAAAGQAEQQADVMQGPVGVPCDPEVPGGAAAAFGGFRDVLALRDELQRARRGHWGSSSCASTAGSTSVAALTGLLSDVEEGLTDIEQVTPQNDSSISHQSLINSPSQMEPPLPAPEQQQQQQRADTAEQQGGDDKQGGDDGLTQQVGGSSPAVTSMTAVLNPAGSPKASKLKLHWLPALEDVLLPLRLVRFSHPVLVEKVTEEVDVVAAFNYHSRSEVKAWGDPSLLRSAHKGHVVQLQRKGFYIIDQVVLKAGARGATESHDGAAAAAAATAAGAEGPGRAACGAADAAVVPVGAEAAAAAAAAAEAAAAAAGACGAGPPALPSRQPPAAALRPCDIQELLLFHIPDGHTKHELMHS